MSFLCFIFLIHLFFFLMIRRPPRSTRTDTLFPYTTLFRSENTGAGGCRRLILDERRLPADVPARPRQSARRATAPGCPRLRLPRSEEHTSELQSLMRISYAVFCLKKKKKKTNNKTKCKDHRLIHITVEINGQKQTHII